MDKQREHEVVAAFNKWAWKKEGDPIGVMHGQVAGLEGFIAGAQWQAAQATAPQSEVKTGETPRTDAYQTSRYNNAMAAAADGMVPGVGGTETSPEEECLMALEFARALERELQAANERAELAIKTIDEEQEIAVQQQRLAGRLKAENESLRAQLATQQADVGRYRKLRGWMSSGVPEGWDEVEKMGALCAYESWDAMNDHLDGLSECNVGLMHKRSPGDAAPPRSRAMDKQREQFETWAVSEGYSVTIFNPVSGQYCNAETIRAWVTWQAAQAAPAAPEPVCCPCGDHRKCITPTNKNCAALASPERDGNK